MGSRIKLFVEVEGSWIPVSISDEKKIFEAIGTQLFDINKNTAITLKEDTNRHSIHSYQQLKTGDITKFLLDNLDKKHSNQSIAKYFVIDIGIGKSIKKKSKEQINAYFKIYGNFKSARKQIKERLSGEWIPEKSGIKNQIIRWCFKKNETGA